MKSFRSFCTIGCVLLLSAAAAHPAACAVPDGAAAHAYWLPPDLLVRARAYSHIRFAVNLGSSVWAILSPLLLLATGAVAWMRDVAVRLSRYRWVQGAVFLSLLLLAGAALDLPLDLYAHQKALEYGQSVQPWAGWLLDMAKSLALSLILGLPVVMLLFWIIRRSPRRWWLWFWAPSMALVLASVFVAPVVIDPLFDDFEPLVRSNPALVGQLERVVAQAGQQIPPERMYLMRASAKVTSLNAYVTGFGASKRVVVWDNTIARATPDEISFIFGHELGHYVLNHIPKTLVLIGALLLLAFWLGATASNWLIARFGAGWRIPSQNDWAAVAVFLMVAAAITLLAEPVVNGFSRHIEHEADVYGQEVIHGIVADPQNTAQRSFQLLGELSLSDPDPHPLIEFWIFSHPSIANRASFAAFYNPWTPGKRPKFFSNK